MLISDWSSDVCSSDLHRGACSKLADQDLRGVRIAPVAALPARGLDPAHLPALAHATQRRHGRDAAVGPPGRNAPLVVARRRPAGRPVGYECVSTFRIRWTPSLKKKKKYKQSEQ